MTIRRSRAAIQRDADHQFIPCAARVSPRTCQVCGFEGFLTFPGTDRERWLHGNLSEAAISHPDADIVFDGGYRRHYPSRRFEGATLCGRTWRDRGRRLRLSDGIRGGVCLDCLVELNKTRERPATPGITWT